jgi:cysteine synthase
VGWSAGAAIAAAIEIVRHSSESVVVVVGCDTGARYLSEPHRWLGP